MVSGLRDSIKVGAVFDKGSIKPMWFQHSGRKITIKNIIYKWQEKSGSNTVIKFSVDDGENMYEIGYNNIDMTWTLFAYDELCISL